MIPRLCCLLLAELALPVQAAENARPQTRLNVLFVIADDLNTRLGCYGDKQAHTPGLDRLAAEGVLFERAYAQAVVCTPSRKSFLTGLSPKITGPQNNNFMQEHPQTMTLPRWFRQNGYQTARVGKVEHTPEYAGPLDWDLSIQEKPLPAKGLATYKFTDRNGTMLGFSQVRPDGQPTTDETNAHSFETFLLEQWDRTKPFFFALGFHAPHLPWEVQQHHLALHPLEQMPLVTTPAGATPMSKPPGYIPRMLSTLHNSPESVPTSAASANQVSLYNSAIDQDTQRHMQQAYYASVSMMDEQLEGVLRFLENQGLADDTLVVFTSDQGYFLGYRGLWSKHYLYPEVLRVPLIVRVPGKAKGARAPGIVELVDLFPTFVELASLPTPSGLEGESFAPLLKDPTLPGKPAAYAQGILYGGCAVTTERFTLLDWKARPWMRPTQLRAGPSEDPLKVIQNLAGTALRKEVEFELDGPQRWINVQVPIEASREFYNLKNDPAAWFNLEGNPDQEFLRHQHLLDAHFPEN